MLFHTHQFLMLLLLLLLLQVIWRRPSGGDRSPISWSRYTWRRGSVPLWWGVHMRNNGLGEAEIKIREACTFKGSRRCCVWLCVCVFWGGGATT
jgi:hypothetical protein